VIGDLASGHDALERLAEIRRSAPAAKVVLLSSRTDADWLADALRAHASAVLPGAVDPQTLGAVLREVIAEPRLAAVLPVPLSRRAVYRSTSHEGKAA
jgi:DNA-binding NarL/FixJ family response regulator